MLALSVLCLVAASLAQAAQFTNPIQNDGPDPFIVYDHDTSSYFLTTTTGSDLKLTSAPTIDGLRTGGHVRQAYQNASMISTPTVWASELHKMDGTWYIYYSHGERPYALQGGATPNDGFSGPPVQLYGKFGIDGTVLAVDKTNYFVWSCTSLDVSSIDLPGSSLCISTLTTPTSIDRGKISVISRPQEGWEQRNGNINEAPQPLYWNNEIYLTFSASNCDSADYSLGLLHLTGSDPLDPTSWTKKTDGPVFSSGNGEFGPGHNGIFASPDGTELWNVYHAVTNPAGSCGTDRQTFVEKIDLTNLKSAGPNFGTPAPKGSVAQGPSGEDAPASAKPDASATAANLAAGPPASSASTPPPPPPSNAVPSPAVSMVSSSSISSPPAISDTVPVPASASSDDKPIAIPPSPTSESVAISISTSSANAVPATILPLSQNTSPSSPSDPRLSLSLSLSPSPSPPPSEQSQASPDIETISTSWVGSPPLTRTATIKIMSTPTPGPGGALSSSIGVADVVAAASAGTTALPSSPIPGVSSGSGGSGCKAKLPKVKKSRLAQ
ncbi:hypothetical protein IAR55_005328 [Kwoniella newhampshirensis]|uniref:Uncharacterized protein n=1 Tax=Kwoniella newhampshirensis TaxID=1651941 RepID=A0AAW0YH60_9TREE